MSVFTQPPWGRGQQCSRCVQNGTWLDELCIQLSQKIQMEWLFISQIAAKGQSLFRDFFTPTGENYYVLTLILYVSQLGLFFWKLKPTTTKKLKLFRRCSFYPTQLKCCRSHKPRQSDKLSSFQCLISNWRDNGYSYFAVWYHTVLILSVWKGVGSFRNISTQLRDICLKLEVKRTGCDQTLMLAWKLLGANISLWVNEYVVLPRNMA